MRQFFKLKKAPKMVINFVMLHWEENTQNLDVKVNFHGQKFRTFEPAFHVRFYRILAIWQKLAIAVGQEMLLIIQSFGRPIELYNKTNEDGEEIFGWKNHRTARSAFGESYFWVFYRVRKQVYIW